MQLSPDPPRDADRDRDELSNGGNHFIMLDEEDVMGEGEHELDYSPHNSDSSDDDDDPGNENAQENVNSRVRAHYQLFVPFISVGDNDDSVQEFHGPTNQDENDPEDEEDPHLSQEVQPTTSNSSTTDNEQSQATETAKVTRREITLNNEKVETIKNVMKNFSLPSSSIPPWAKEINDDVWKNKLLSKLEDKKPETSDESIPNESASKSNES